MNRWSRHLSLTGRGLTAVGEDDMERLQEAGLEDRVILDVALISAYYNFINRIADGLGVELDQEYVESRVTHCHRSNRVTTFD